MVSVLRQLSRLLRRGKGRSAAGEAARGMASQATPIGGHEYDFDVVVIGGGSGGLATSKECAKLGAKVRDYSHGAPPRAIVVRCTEPHLLEPTSTWWG
jgi:hypothetical protein